MTVSEAIAVKNAFQQSNSHTDDDVFMFTEAMDYLITETHDPALMLELGGYYYDEQKFDLALKYYEMSASLDYLLAYVCLGYIWYYGRTGEKDYKKAFEYYSKAAAKGHIVSEYKVADMYKNGYYVEKDYEKYVQIIEGLYPKVMHPKYTNDPVPEIYTRLADIRVKQGDTESAKELYLKARDFLEQRIEYNNFFGNLNIMKWLIHDYYAIEDFSTDNISLYDLYYLLDDECEIRFTGNNEVHYVKAFYEDDSFIITLDESQFFRNTDDFFRKAAISGTLLTDVYSSLTDFEVIRWKS